MMTIKWQSIRKPYGDTTYIDGFEVTRSRLSSGSYLYYAHWLTNTHYTVPHHHMSSPYRSLKQVRRHIASLKTDPNEYWSLERYQSRSRLTLITGGVA